MSARIVNPAAIAAVTRRSQRTSFTLVSMPSRPRPRYVLRCDAGMKQSSRSAMPGSYAGLLRLSHEGTSARAASTVSRARNKGDQPPAGTTMPGMNTAVSPA